jgi:hypothetical protein
LFLLTALAAYYLLLHSESFSDLVKKRSCWFFSQLTERRVVGISTILLGAYTVWYVYYVSGKSLIGKDFGAFFYRYLLLDQLFPSIIGYNPMLNAGERTIELLASGSINLFLLTYPIAALTSVEVGFKSQLIVVILLLPGLIYLSGRLVRFSHMESFLSASFALVMTPIGHMGLGQVLFHGSLPYVFSCELAVIIFALSYRVFILGRNAVWGIVLIILLGSLASLHPIFFVVMGPVALATVVFGKIKAKQRIVYSVMIGAGLLMFNAFWVHQLLSYDHGQFVGQHIGVSHQPSTGLLKKLEQTFFGFQAFLVIASAVGVRCLLRHTEPEKKSLGGLLLSAIVYYAFLSSGGWFIIAPLQPERFVVPLSFFLSFALGASWPAIKGLWSRIQNEGTPNALAFSGVLCVLTLFVCVPYSVFVVGLPTASPTSLELVSWLRENVNDSGRVFFNVPARGAHITPLEAQVPFYQATTQRPLIGVPGSNIFKGWPIVSWIQEVRECLTDPKSASSCRDLYNIHYAVTVLGNGTETGLSSRQEGLSNNFRLVKAIGSIQIYETNQPSSYFLVGRGEVKQYLNRIAVTAEPTECVVLKFFWAPGLHTNPPLKLEPYPLPNGKAFIKVRSNLARSFDIVYP